MSNKSSNYNAQVQELLVEIAVLKTKLEERDKALEKQADEYERRLDILNHAHQEAKNVDATRLPREIFENTIKEWQSWQAKVDRILAERHGGINVVSVVFSYFLSVLALVIASLAVFDFY